METIEKGDFIQSYGLPVYGVVIGEGHVCSIPAFKIRTPDGNVSAILKGQAELICKDDTAFEAEWQRQQKEIQNGNTT